MIPEDERRIPMVEFPVTVAMWRELKDSVESLRGEVGKLTARVAELEKKPAPVAAPASVPAPESKEPRRRFFQK